MLTAMIFKFNRCTYFPPQFSALLTRFYYSKASSNYAGESGGVLYVEHQAKVTITGSYFADNNVGDFGGALGFNECMYLCKHISISLYGAINETLVVLMF